MSASTPIADCKTAALARILDSIPKGYTRYTLGEVKPEKAQALAQKLHQRHAIGATPARRLTRKQHGLANTLLVMYYPPDAQIVHWLMLFTPGELESPEQLCEVSDKKRLVWLGYELVRRSEAGKTSWTWRRTKAEMKDVYALLNEQLRQHHYAAVEASLQRLANQPGFHGVREQSWVLQQHARARGYKGELPHLYFVQKINHGERLVLSDRGRHSDPVEVTGTASTAVAVTSR